MYANAAEALLFFADVFEQKVRDDADGPAKMDDAAAIAAAIRETAREYADDYAPHNIELFLKLADGLASRLERFTPNTQLFVAGMTVGLFTAATLEEVV